MGSVRNSAIVSAYVQTCRKLKVVYTVRYLQILGVGDVEYVGLRGSCSHDDSLLVRREFHLAKVAQIFNAVKVNGVFGIAYVKAVETAQRGADGEQIVAVYENVVAALDLIGERGGGVIIGELVLSLRPGAVLLHVIAAANEGKSRCA